MFYLVDKTEDVSPGHSMSDYSERLLWRGKRGAKKFRNFYNKDQVVRTSKEYCLMKENQTSQVKEFSACLCFYVWNDMRVWVDGNHSCDMHLSYLGPVSWAFSFSSPQGVPLGVAAMSDGLMTSIKFPTWLPLGLTAWGGCNGLMVTTSFFFFYYTHIWQATLLLLTSSIREDKGLRISPVFLKTFNDFLWHWQKFKIFNPIYTDPHDLPTSLSEVCSLLGGS